MSCENITYRTIEILLNQNVLDRQQLQSLQTAIANVDNQTALIRAIVGERCWAHRYFTTGFPTTIPGMCISGLLDAQLVTYLDVMSEFLQVTQLEYPQKYQKALEIENQIDNLPFYKYFIRGYGIALARGFDLQTGCHARNLLIRTALAIEQFRVTHNRLPETLNELTSDLLAEIPHDPFDPNNNPLLYRQNATGYTLYSIGKDQADNNGTKYDANGCANEPGTILFGTWFAARQGMCCPRLNLSCAKGAGGVAIYFCAA